MSKKYSGKVHQEPLRDEWAKSLLAARDPNCGGSLYDYLQAQKKELTNSIQRCRDHLEMNPLTDVVSEAAAREAGRGGTSTITVNEQGTILLEVRPKRSGEKRTWMSSLPSINELRAEAERMNLDISELGRSKRKIYDAVREAKGVTPVALPQPIKVPKKAKKMFKTGDSVTVPRIATSADLPFDESTNLPSDLLDGDKPDLPDLKAVLANSEDLDLDALLGSKSE